MVSIHLTKIKLFSNSKSNDLIHLQSSDSIWLMQIYMWYSILSLLTHVNFRLTPDPSWTTKTSGDLKTSLTSDLWPHRLFRYSNATSCFSPSWMTTSGNPRTQSWPLTFHHTTLLFQLLNKRKEIVLFRFSQRVMF